MSLNRAPVIDHLGQDPEMRYTASGLPVGNFSVTTDEVYLHRTASVRIVWNGIVW